MLSAKNKEHHFLCSLTDGDSGQDVSDFNWDEYLEENGTLSVPHHAFKHVSKSVALYK